jgi:hypothetical protein
MSIENKRVVETINLVLTFEGGLMILSWKFG